eukprot:Nitzschia sp. Nitz4//scaffold88_size82704//45204//46496//NITZ4_005296-RA/size82704-processed-gene-0.52-mRNA-1//1//CDS//3329559506//6747//frame0
MSVFDSCSEGCGWTAAIIAVLSWGTFGVPLKVNTNVEVNFFVMQSYKTIVCFVTSFLVIFLGTPVRWTWWGVVSGMFWVPGAACGIYGIRNAGVAIAVGTWSAIQVSTSFIFGIIIFKESVKDFQQTMLAFVILMVGLVGMSVYSEKPKKVETEYEALATSETEAPVVIPKRAPLQRKGSKGTIPGQPENYDLQLEATVVSATPVASTIIPLELENGKDTLSAPLMDDKAISKDRMVFFGGRVALTRRQLGIVGAIVNGVWGGMNLIPLHYAQRDPAFRGAGYVVSYAGGSMIVCMLIWAGLFVFHYIKRDYQVQEALDQLPAWHVRELGLPGVLAGIFYSIGNFCSILAVTYLGQGVGFSFCQGQLFVSGLWGVFYFGEIQGQETITKWFASAAVTIVGIIWLSYQHEGPAVHRFLLSLLDDPNLLLGS